MDKLEIKPMYGHRDAVIQVEIDEDGDKRITIMHGKFIMAVAYIADEEWEQIKEFWK